MAAPSREGAGHHVPRKGQKIDLPTQITDRTRIIGTETDLRDLHHAVNCLYGVFGCAGVDLNQTFGL